MFVGIKLVMCTVLGSNKMALSASVISWVSSMAVFERYIDNQIVLVRTS